MKPQVEIGRSARESGGVRGSEGGWNRGLGSGIRARGLFLSLLLIVGTAELATSGVADAAPQTANSADTTPLPSAKLPNQDWHPQITLRVYNYAHVNHGVLLSAEALAASILREAKVEVKWIDCPLSQEEFERYPACHAVWGTNAFVLNILTPEMAAKIRTHVEPLGSAMTSCDDDAATCLIRVFYSKIAEVAAQASGQPERLLGHVIAHEVGHVILGANHSSKGIMRGVWGRDDLKFMGVGILGFSTEQAAQMRATLLRPGGSRRSHRM